MGKFIDLTGRQFGAWKVIATSGRASWWLCRCKCGTERAVRGDTLRNGTSTQCFPCRRNSILPEVAILDPSVGVAFAARESGLAERAARQLLWRDAYYDNGGALTIGGDRVAVIKLTRGFFSIVDEVDFDLIAAHSWSVKAAKNGKQAYACTYTKSEGARIKVAMHYLFLGPWVDHRDLDGLNNRRCNLRLTTSTLNNANVYLRSHNSTGFKGVVIQKGRFVAQICSFGKNRRIGKFTSATAAALAYDAEARRAFGEFARTNFPENTNV